MGTWKKLLIAAQAAIALTILATPSVSEARSQRMAVPSGTTVTVAPGSAGHATAYCLDKGRSAPETGERVINLHGTNANAFVIFGDGKRTKLGEAIAAGKLEVKGSGTYGLIFRNKTALPARIEFEDEIQFADTAERPAPSVGVPAGPHDPLAQRIAWIRRDAPALKVLNSGGNTLLLSTWRFTDGNAVRFVASDGSRYRVSSSMSELSNWAGKRAEKRGASRIAFETDGFDSQQALGKLQTAQKWMSIPAVSYERGQDVAQRRRLMLEETPVAAPLFEVRTLKNVARIPLSFDGEKKYVLYVVAKTADIAKKVAALVWRKLSGKQRQPRTVIEVVADVNALLEAASIDRPDYWIAPADDIRMGYEIAAHTRSTTTRTESPA